MGRRGQLIKEGRCLINNFSANLLGYIIGLFDRSLDGSKMPKYKNVI